MENQNVGNEIIDNLRDVIAQIMAIPEDDSMEQRIKLIHELFVNMIEDNEMREQHITEIIDGFYHGGASRFDVDQLVSQMREAFTEYIDSLETSEVKKKLIAFFIDCIMGVFEEAAERYKGDDAVVIFEKMNEDAKIPVYIHEGDTCADLYACEKQIIPAHSLSNKVHTGLKMKIPLGWGIEIRLRSGHAAKTGLRISNGVGTVDSGYRGEVCVLLDNFGDEDYMINVGDRIAQIYLERANRFTAVEGTVDADTDRAEGGFGSSGK